MEEEDKVEDWDGSDNDQQDGLAPLNAACTYKIIIVGDSNVGKTCLAWRFCSGQFLNKTAATIGVDFQEKSIELEGERIKLQVWDTAGQERFRKSMVQHYYRNVQAVIFCYDVTKLASFDALAIWLEEFDRYSTTGNIPRILVGNKCDCKSKKVVSSNMARKFADAHNMPLWETSAKDDNEQDTIRSIFLTLAHKLKYQRPLMPSKKDRYGNSKAGLDTISVQLEEPENGKKHRCSSCSSGGSNKQ